MNKAIECSRKFLASLDDEGRRYCIDRIRDQATAWGVKKHFQLEVDMYTKIGMGEDARKPEFKRYIAALLGMF